ncbi:MAG: hypothetical protein JSW58_10260 [Candidatus Latescibacterota bacterium]|nr:MAG: hypothetical protein JSW58_10260 [Candidatus Latescibacterota bacterium]
MSSKTEARKFQAECVHDFERVDEPARTRGERVHSEVASAAYGRMTNRFAEGFGVDADETVTNLARQSLK